MRGDEQLVGANHDTPALQVRPDLRVVERGTLVEIHRLDAGEEGRQGGGVMRVAGGNLDTVEQFRLRDHGHA